jgi:nitrogen regulatory protein P-II 2
MASASDGQEAPVPEPNPFTDRTVHLSLVTIVIESILEQRITRALRDLGVSGFTITAARGDGQRGFRTGDVEGGNVKIETIVHPDRAAEVLAYVEEHYFENYAVIAWVSEVGVLRGDKYV